MKRFGSDARNEEKEPVSGLEEINLTNCLFEIKNQFEKTILFQQVSK
jgi:hypothetical protein